MISFLKVVSQSVAATEKTRVTCGTCPVSLACVVGEGGTGWKFDCCGSTAVRIEDQILLIDCAKNNFEQHKDAKEHQLCPLCSGGIMEAVERGRLDGGQDPNRYVLTVYAKVPFADRLAVWRRTHVEALHRLEVEASMKRMKLGG